MVKDVFDPSKLDVSGTIVVKLYRMIRCGEYNPSIKLNTDAITTQTE